MQDHRTEGMTMEYFDYARTFIECVVLVLIIRLCWKYRRML